jgi:hypothetical protein
MQRVYRHETRAVLAELDLGTRQREALGVAAEAVIAHRSCVAGQWQAHTGRRGERFISREEGLSDTLRQSWIAQVLKACPVADPVLLVDETKLGNRLSVMMVSLLTASGAVPLCWRTYQSSAYPEEGQVAVIVRLLEEVRRVLPRHRRPLVLADRGIGTSPALIRHLLAMRFDYLLRVQRTTRLRSRSGHDQALGILARRGVSFRRSGWLFKKAGRLWGHAYLHWQAEYEEPWCLVSNRHDLNPALYASRFQQEMSFRDLKSDGFQWQRSRVWNPVHADWLLLLLALAYFLVHQTIPALLAAHSPARRRKVSGFRLALRLLSALHFLHTYAHLLPFALRDGPLPLTVGI